MGCHCRRSQRVRFPLQTGAVPLATVVRRVLTGYAGTFNRRHHRRGDLFQDRYKSILCQGESYLLDRVRYLGEFAAAALAAGGEGLTRRQRLRRPGDAFDWRLRRVAAVAGLSPADQVTPSKIPSRLRPRSLFCSWAVQALGLPGPAVGARLGLTQSAVRRGARLAKEQGLALPEGYIAEYHDCPVFCILDSLFLVLSGRPILRRSRPSHKSADCSL